MHKHIGLRNMALGLCVTTVVPKVAAAQASSFNGPHEGAPFGGSSISAPGRTSSHPPKISRTTSRATSSNAARSLTISSGCPCPPRCCRSSTAQQTATGYRRTTPPRWLNLSARAYGRLVSLHSVYDSLDPAHSPSRARMQRFSTAPPTRTSPSMASGQHCASPRPISARILRWA